ncbi:MAG: permease [Thermodesulfobacteriota bacterium]|nr:permease [Thermodesulfobacteriota bacterium]
MNVTVWIMLFLAGTLTVLAYMKDHTFPLEGLKAGGGMLLQILPTLILAFIAAGMITKVLPHELLSNWLGEESGLRGLLLATFAGSFTPGGPFVQFPIVAALLKAGAGVAPLMAYISAWSLLGVNRFLIYEIPLLGWKLSVARIVASMIFPIIIGILTRFLWIRL